MYQLSSDSEDDCYDKFPEKLQKLRTKYALTNILETIDLTNIPTHTNSVLDVCPVKNQNSYVEEVLDEEEVSDPVLEGVTTRSRSKRKNVVTEPSVSKRGRGRGKNLTPCASQSRGRSKRGRGARHDTRNVRITSSTSSPRHRGRRRKLQPQTIEPLVTYSIGNTHEYPDASEHQALFTNHKKPTPEVIDLTTTIDLDESLDNEELSVKVYWQHSEVFKFNIRRLQKMTQIFDFFMKKEEVSEDRLLFTYNDANGDIKMLQPDDTPNSINYNIAKFIEGGIVNKEFNLGSQNLINSAKKKGFVIKFQCQSKKKPLEYLVGKDEKLKMAMVMFAENLELPISSLVYEFDGEVVLGNATPNDLEMESGDCIDVKIVNVNQ